MACAKQLEVDVLDSWEDIDAEVLEQKFATMKMCKVQNAARYARFPSPGVHPVRDAATRSPCQSSEPMIRILKRPEKGNAATPQAEVVQPKKTLQQREKEYAEARLRILGSAGSPEEPEEISPPRSNTKRPRVRESVIRVPKGPDGSKGFAQR